MSKIKNSTHGVFSNAEQVKVSAARLKKDMKENFNVDLKISEIIEIVARQFGFKNYNTLLGSLNKCEDSKYKIIEYNLTFKNEELKRKILVEIEKSITETKKCNADYHSTVHVNDLNIIFTSYFNPELTTNQPKDLTVLLICEYKKEILNNEIICIKEEKIKRHEIVDLNKSLSKSVKNCQK